ncbi:MAG: DKNYY domain-containing protein [Candidatus Tenebribacter burtonii]|jgi:hypothetical protein|nr:DKNYY domain-containing protein [Candidatus Tenebribacter burtonii]
MKHFKNPNKYDRLGNGYSVLNDEIYYKESVPSYSSYMPRPEKTNISFESFTNLGYRYAKDFENIYYKGQTLLSADYKSFSVIQIGEEFPTLPKEDFHEITSPINMDDQQSLKSVKMDMMPFKKQSLIIVLEYYAIDKFRVYYGSEVISNADPSTFKLLSLLYSKDENHVFYKGKSIPDADPATFKLISVYLARDKKHIYFDAEIISDNPTTFRIINETYAADIENVWFGYNFLVKPTLHVLLVEYPSDFEVISEFYSKDSENIYFRDSKIESVNVKHFQLLGGFWSKDDQHIFLFDKVCEEADYKTFEVVADGARDKNRVYDKNYRIRD